MAPVTGWELARAISVTESDRPWKLPAAGAMRQRWITPMFIPAAFCRARPTTYSPPCVTSVGHDLQRSQILQVSPVINQSNMSRVLSLWPSLRQFTTGPWKLPTRFLIVHLSFPSQAGPVKWCVNYKLQPAINIKQYRPEKCPFMLLTCISAALFSLTSFIVRHLCKIPQPELVCF